MGCGLIHRDHDIGCLYHRIDLFARGKFQIIGGFF